jgi:putative peptidoglycan lipid II flippase
MNIGRLSIKNIRSIPLIRDTLSTTFFSTIGRGLGLLIPFFIATWFGATDETDAFFFSYNIIIFLSVIFAPVVESVIVPYVSEARSNGEDVGEFIGDILSISGLGLAGIFLLSLIVIKPLLTATTIFNEQSRTLIFFLFLETGPLLILLVWTSILSGTLNAYKMFAIPALCPGFRALISLSIIFTIKDQLGIHAIVLGYVLGEATRIILLMAVIRQKKLFILKISFRFTEKLKSFVKTSSLQIIGMIGTGLSPIVNSIIASWFGAGYVSVLYYAERLYMIPLTFLTTGFMVTTLSYWSSDVYESRANHLLDNTQKTVKIISLITLAINAFLILFHQPLLKLALHRSELPPSAVSEIGWVWVCYLFGLAPTVIGRVYSRGHLTLKNTKVFMYSGFFSLILNFTLNLVLISYMGIAGIAVGTTLTAAFYLIYMRQTLIQKIGR